ncbi:MAG: MoaD/ThiS family protein [ANME-2 cluster archaeon]|nr:MAG: MoaD/ThiS family protein [ANME-2 cluster archaeon]
MKIRVKVLAGGVSEKSIDIEQGSTYYDVLACLKINPETVIIMVDHRPVPVDEMVSTDYLEILRVVSGG